MHIKSNSTNRFWIIAVALLISCSSAKQISTSSKPGLKDAFKNDFLIGTALNPQQFGGNDAQAVQLIEQQFNQITPENVMKSERVHPQQGRYDFTLADQYVDFGQKHAMFIVGHTLIWHSQLPLFARQITSRDSLIMYMRDHISTVAGRYSGKVNGWDVVNEALNEDGTMRNSSFYRLIGESFIDSAFIYAAQAAPGTELYYNDYNIEQPAKRKGAIRIIKHLKERGIRIDGVGIQGHWTLEYLPLADIEQSIKEFAALGVKVMFTELDISVLPRPKGQQGADVNQNFDIRTAANPYTGGLPDSVQKQLADAYQSLFKLFLENKKDITRITFWGVNDKNSWLNNFPIRGRTDYPLLFDRNNQAKPAYFEVMALGRH